MFPKKGAGGITTDIYSDKIISFSIIEIVGIQLSNPYSMDEITL